MKMDPTGDKEETITKIMAWVTAPIIKHKRRRVDAELFWTLQKHHLEITIITHHTTKQLAEYIHFLCPNCYTWFLSWCRASLGSWMIDPGLGENTISHA
jgi:hypothetical protein